jgi:pyruvate, water dikinase
MLRELHSVDSDDFGGKALELGRALRAGLPVPAGFALSPSFVERIVAGDSSARQQAATASEKTAWPPASRAST